MTTHRILNLALAAAILAAWMATAAHFDKKVFEGDARHNADLKVQQRKQAAADKICGLNGAARWIDDTTLVCSLHTGKGRPTVTAGAFQ